MNHDDERDYAEEQANASLLRDEQEDWAPVELQPPVTIRRVDEVSWVAIVSWGLQWFEGPFGAQEARDVAAWHNSGAGVHAPKRAVVIEVP